MEDKIKKIMSSVFEIDQSKITTQSSSETIENWDSLRHMNLVVAIEEEFDIEFDDDEIMELMEFEKIIEIINSKK